jgi:hypothetical protein
VSTPHEVALLRLVAQRIAGPRLPTAVEAVRRLTAVQAQDLPGALLSVALRTAEGTRADVEAALDSGEVVRSWPMRGTLHLVAAEDLHWLIGLLGPRVLAGAPARRAQLGITDESIEQARGIAVEALGGGRRLRRKELLGALADGGVEVAGQRGYHLLWYLSQTSTLCFGPMADGEQCFVLMDDWIRAPRRLEPDEALAELAGRFFRGHGPATVKDLARWANIRITEARAGLAAVRETLARLEVDGVEHFLDPETPDLLADCRKEARGTFLLPGFDEFVLGYGDRSAVLDPAFADRIVPGGNGMFRPTVVSDGRIVGTWQWTGRGAARTVTPTPFTDFPPAVATAVPRLAASVLAAANGPHPGATSTLSAPS